MVNYPGMAPMQDLHGRPIRVTRKSSSRGAIAQLGEHLLCKQGVVGSIPTGSTTMGRGTLECICAHTNLRRVDVEVGPRSLTRWM